ncbi:unnamed protein product [Bursaphelenchus okinawaensis]|uniref:Uncharacterized protein n=1 Tax=Bursaphelenchus okinawaensis TaxID=465554 RepID=A0A811LRP5_9BILA|nr:unnamed protein product [Bursaphelenchus okinawaensis]CAG9128310.1 unnamed protein product [Bursaphelenchus okinawaensis]
MQFNLTYIPMILPSERLRTIACVYAWIVHIFNAGYMIFTINIVIYCSPSKVGVYKYYVVWSNFCLTIMMMLFASYEIEMLGYYKQAVARGVVEFFNMPQLGIVLQNIAYAFFESNVVIVLCRFVYRWAQATSKERIVNFMSGQWFLLLLILLCSALICKTISLSFNHQANSEAFKKEFPSDDPVLKAYIMEHAINVVEPNQFDFIFQQVVFPCVILAGTFCTIQCYRMQCSPLAPRLSHTTRQMYKLLINVLVFEQLYVVFYCIIPFMFTKYFIPPKYAAIAEFIILRACYLYPTFVMTFTLAFYRQYRSGVVSFFGRIRVSNSLVPSVSSHHDLAMSIY